MVELPFIEQAPKLDAHDREWADAPAIVLERREQLVETGHLNWRGPKDASVRVRLLYDRSHLYLFCELRDQRPTAPRAFESWESGDVIELFFDCDLRDDGPGKERFDDDDLQVLLIPFGNERRWAAIDMLPLETQELSQPVMADRGLSGIRIARRFERRVCYLEVAIPLHNLPQLSPGAREIGFNLALGDRDRPGDSYNYLVWSGHRSPIDRTSSFGRLRFVGPSILEAEAGDAGAWLRVLQSALFYLLLGLCLLALLVLARRSVRRLLVESTRQAKLWTLVLGAVAISAWLLPSLVLGVYDSGRFEDLRGLAARMQERLPQLEEGGLAELRGESRDGPLIELLGGRALQLPVAQDFLSFTELAPELMGLGAEHSETLDASFRVYAMPLGQEAQRFGFVSDGAGDVLVLLLSQEPGEFRMGEEPSIRLRFESSEGEEEQEPPLIALPELPRFGVTRPRFAAELKVPAGSSAFLLASDSLGLRLEGAAVRRGASTAKAEPLWLGAVSKIGVPSVLRGENPELAGFLLLPGQKRKLPLPKAQKDVTGLWLFVEGLEGPAFSGVSDGLTVGRVRVQFKRRGKGRPEQVFELRHQREIFARDMSANSELERLGEAGLARIAYEWEGRDGGARMTPALELAFGAPGELQEMSLESSSPYAIRVREIVFVRTRGPQAVSRDDAAFVASGRAGERHLRADWLEDVSRANCFVFRQRQLTAGPRELEVKGLSLDADLARSLESESLVLTRNQLVSQGDSYDAFLSLDSEVWGDAVLALSIPDDSRATLSRNLFRSSVAVAVLALALLLVFASELFWGRFSLRFQLGGLFLVAGVLPLLLLALFLVQILEGQERKQQEEHALSGLSKLEERLDEGRAELEKGARSLLRSLGDSLAEYADSAKRDDVLARAREGLELARPSDWHPDSFLILRLPPTGGEERAVRVWDRERSRRLGDRPLGAGSGLYLRWGSLVLGARAELERGPGQGLRVSLGRVLDAEWLQSLAIDGELGLYDLDGYPLVVAGDASDSSRLPGALAERRAVLEQLRASPGSHVELLKSGGGRLAAFSLLRDPTGKMLGMLGVSRPFRGATLAPWGESVPLRRFFVVLVGFLLMLSLFLAWSLTERVSRPMERLSLMARRIAAGDLALEVPPLGGQDEVAGLNRAFGSMTAELRERVTQLDRTNSAIRDLGSTLELERVAERGLELCLEACGADSGMLLLLDRESGDLRLFGEAEGPRNISRHGALAHQVLSAGGPCELLLGQGAGLAGFPALVGAGRILVLPLRIKERVQGAVLVGVRGHWGRDIEFEHVQALLQQLASAAETARIYRLAIEDGATGLAVRRYFRRRLAQELERSQRSGDLATLLRLEIEDAASLRSSLGEEFFDHLLGRLGAEIDENLPEHGVAGRTGLAVFELLLPGTGAEEGRRTLRMLRGLLEGLALDSGASCRILGEAVVFPEDGGSAAFLLDSLERRRARPEPEDSSAAAASDLSTSPIETAGAVWASSVMRELLDKIERVASTQIPVLVVGETGTGKEIVVDRLHAFSERRDAPLVKVNCAAIPGGLLESELFGHEQGAFTGASERKRGLFESADGGSLFLDEIGELPYQVQAKLLRVLQSGEFQRVGGQESIRVDVRLFAATHRDLSALLEEGRFREDLYYRLQGVQLQVPPLRERKMEIPDLVEFFRREFGEEARKFSPGALDRLYRHPWPGNVRELRNVVMRALVLARGHFVEAEDLELEEVGAQDLPAPQLGVGGSRRSPPTGPVSDLVGEKGLQHRLVRLLEELKHRAPEEGIRPKEYCRLLGVSRRTASRDLQRFVAEGRLRAVGARRSQRYLLAEL